MKIHKIECDQCGTLRDILFTPCGDLIQKDWKYITSENGESCDVHFCPVCFKKLIEKMSAKRNEEKK